MPARTTAPAGRLAGATDFGAAAPSGAAACFGSAAPSRVVAFVGLAALVGSAAPAVAQDPARPTLSVGVLGDEVRLDGILDEPFWGETDSIGGLTMTEPDEGGDLVGRTTVRVAASARDLVIGIVAYDPDPDGIVSVSKQRDPPLRGEDHILLVLDTFRDRRSGYAFGITPGGARYDALISGQGERQSADWDGVWEAVTRRGPWGWSVEIRIPLNTLSFGDGLDAWGFNIERRIERLQEVSRWASPRRDYAVTQMARAGDLTDLPEFDLGIGISIRPALVGSVGVPEVDADVDASLEPSLDVQQRLGTNVAASLTVNTDFAETEVDTRRTNLTRFPLFFQEKRTFFLEGSDIFSFGFGLGNDVRPFHSRRIGLVSGTEVPLNVGGKTVGRVGDTNFGVLAVRTGSETGVAPATSMGVLRVQQNVLSESTLGVIGTLGDPVGRDGSWLGGADFTYRTSSLWTDKNFIAGFWGLAMNRSDLQGDRTALGVSLDYPNDLFDVFLSYKRIGESFDPSLGFVPRAGIQAMSASITYLPRPALSWLRTMRWELFNTLVTDLSGQWESYRIFTAPINAGFESGDRTEANLAWEGERLTEPFEIADGVVIPVGSYSWLRYRLEQQFASKRQLSGQVSWWFGDFYTGTLDQLSGRVSWRPSATLSLSLTGTRNSGRLPEGTILQELVGTRVQVNVSPDLQVNALVQYDNESGSVGANTRLRWTFSPVGDLFLVYNHNLQDLGDRWIKDSNQFLAKVQYAFRR
jgi:Domain of unknown function (DUF5916)